jgi:hypothetical protein
MLLLHVALGHAVATLLIIPAFGVCLLMLTKAGIK